MAILLAVALGGVAFLVVSALGQWVPADEMPQASAAPTLGERVTVIVLNAGGVSGMAARARTHLRDAGFDVVTVGNAESFSQDSTVVIDLIGNPERAQAVARSLGVRRVVSEPNPALFADVTVRLGPEWSPPSVRAEEMDREESPASAAGERR